MNSPVRMAGEFMFKWMPGLPILLRARYRESLGTSDISYDSCGCRDSSAMIASYDNRETINKRR